MSIQVEKISKDGLSKEIWEFDYEDNSNELIYTSHYNVNRSNKREVWADLNDRTPLEYDEWCESQNLDPDDRVCINENTDFFEFRHLEKYMKYCDSINPVCQYTRQGKPKLSGISAEIEDLPPCPKDIAKKAVVALLKNIKKSVKVCYRKR